MIKPPDLTHHDLFSAHPVHAEVTKPISVCFVIENLLSAGTERWVVRLLESLDPQRFAVSLVLTDGAAEASRMLEPRGVPVLRLELATLKHRGLWRAMRRLAGFLREHSVDVLQVHHADPSYLAVPVARWVGVRCIVQTKYDVGYWLRGADLWIHRAMRPWIDRTIANCQACRDAAVRQEWADRTRVVVIENGIEHDSLLAIPALDPASLCEPLQVGMVANLRSVKNPHLLLDAYQILVQQGWTGHLHLAGDGDLRLSLQERIDRQGWNSGVTLLGRVDDIVSFWRRMDVAVLCSDSEGLPHAILEAMAAGRPVVATDVGGTRDVIRDQVHGRLIPCGDAVALAQALRQVAQSPAQSLAWADAAREMVRSRFAFVGMIERFEEFYTQLVASRTLRVSATRNQP